MQINKNQCLSVCRAGGRAGGGAGGRSARRSLQDAVPLETNLGIPMEVTHGFVHELGHIIVAPKVPRFELEPRTSCSGFNLHVVPDRFVSVFFVNLCETL